MKRQFMEVMSMPNNRPRPVLLFDTHDPLCTAVADHLNARNARPGAAESLRFVQWKTAPNAYDLRRPPWALDAYAELEFPPKILFRRVSISGLPDMASHDLLLFDKGDFPMNGKIDLSKGRLISIGGHPGAFGRVFTRLPHIEEYKYNIGGRPSRPSGIEDAFF
jgi:hypothetical protein